MPKIVVEGPDGRKFAFPDTMPRAEINAFMRQKYGTKAPNESVQDYLARYGREQAATEARVKDIDREATAVGRAEGERAAGRMGVSNPFEMAFAAPAIGLAQQEGGRRVFDREGTVLADEAAGLSAANAAAFFVPGMVNKEFGAQLEEGRRQQPLAAFAGDVAGGFGPGEIIGAGVSKAAQAIGPGMAALGRMFSRGPGPDTTNAIVGGTLGGIAPAETAEERARNVAVGAGLGAVARPVSKMAADFTTPTSAPRVAPDAMPAGGYLGRQSMRPPGSGPSPREIETRQQWATATPIVSQARTTAQSAQQAAEAALQSKAPADIARAKDQKKALVGQLQEAQASRAGMDTPEDARLSETLASLNENTSDPVLLSTQISAAKTSLDRLLTDIGSPVEGNLIPVKTNILTRTQAPRSAAEGPQDRASVTRYAEGSDDIKPMGFAGPRAKGADLDALQVAQQQVAAGRTPQEVWSQTGWYQAKDGKWTFEIDDSAARIANPNGKKLDQFLSHPTLFKNYPSLRGVRVEVNPQKVRPGEAYYDRVGNKMVLGSADIDSAIHEIQHLIQKREGRLQITNPDAFDYQKLKAAGIEGDPAAGVSRRDAAYNRSLSETEARASADRRGMSAEERAATFPEQSYDVAPEDVLGTTRKLIRSPFAALSDVRSAGAGTPKTPEQAVRFETPGSPEYEAAVAKGLDMSQAGRMARAKEMGFDTDTVLYHGTDAEFDAFDLSKAGKNDWGWYGEGVYLTPDKSYATKFGTPKPYVVKAKNLYDWRASEEGGLGLRFGNKEAAQQKTRELKAKGFDGVRVIDDFFQSSSPVSDKVWSQLVEGQDWANTPLMRNTLNQKLKEGVDRDWVVSSFGEQARDLLPNVGKPVETVIFDPSNIRSVNAAFDPEKSGSSTLLAAAPFAAVGGAGLTSERELGSKMKDDTIRADGTKKDTGFLGPLKRPDGMTMTEYSVGVNIDGRDVEIPTLVPTLTQEEIDLLLNLPDGDKPPRAIINKAIDHARGRIKNNKSPFWNPQDDGPRTPKKKD